MADLEDLRLDKWLWCVRIFKTRQLAADACRLQRVKIGGQECRAARSLRVGDILTVELPDLTRTVQVLGLLERRVGAALVEKYLIDLTPPEEWERARRRREETRLNHATMPAVKPAKRDRRRMTAFLDEVQRAAGAGD